MIGLHCLGGPGFSSCSVIGIDWYRSIDDQSITTQKPLIDCYRLAQQPTRDVTHAIFVRSAAIFSRHWGRSWKNKSSPVFSTQLIYPVSHLFHVYSNYHLPVIVFPCHYVDARSLGRGSTEYKVYHVCRFEVNVGEVFTASKKRGECGNTFKGHLQLACSAGVFLASER